MSTPPRLALSSLLALCAPFVGSAFATNPTSATAMQASQQPAAGSPHAAWASSSQMESLLAAWRAVHGGEWQLVPDAESGYLSLFYGGAVEPTARPRSDADYVELARSALAATEPLHGLPAATLVHERTTFLPLGQVGSSDKTTVRFRQEVDGVPVVAARVNVLFDAAGALLSIHQSNGLPYPDDVAGTAVIDERTALARAVDAFRQQFGLPPNELGQVQLAILRERVATGVRGRLVWQIDLGWIAEDMEPEGRLYSIDAREGSLVRAEPTIHSFDVRGKVFTRASPGVLPDTPANPETSQVMQYVTVESAAGIVRTNEDGQFTFVGVNVPLECTVRYAGKFNNVVNNGNAGQYVQTTTLPPGVLNQVVMNRQDHVQFTGASNVYLTVNRLRDWVRAINPADTTADFEVISIVNYLAVCTANYILNSSIRFGRQGQGPCVNTAYSSIVAHEHGHWMNDRYGTGNGPDGMGEGNADVFAMYLWDDPQVGLGWTWATPGSYLRTGLNTRQFCGDCCGGCYGEVHADGEVWMGAAWKIRERLNTTHGDAAGDLVADSLFLAWMNAFNHTTIDSSIQPQWVLLDDDDGNLFNGTPNYCDIQCGFRDQGFPGMSLPPGCCP